jgi:hypothetical protein
VLNVSTLESDGIAAPTTGEAIGLTSLVSTIALIALFGAGFVATAGRHLSRAYPTTAAIAAVLVAGVLIAARVVAAGHRGHAGGHHGRFRHAAGHGGPGRARLAARELLASAAPRGCGLPSPPAEPESLTGNRLDSVLEKAA